MLGEFEYLLISAASDSAIRLTAARSSVRLPQLRRRCSIGALYTTIDRLEGKGLVKTYMGPRLRSGRPAKRMVRVTPKGVQAAKSFYDAVTGISRGRVGQ